MSVNLQAVRDRIASGWTQGNLARTEGGKAAGSEESNATSWCLVGAAYKEGVDADQIASALRFRDALSMAAWNDSGVRTQAEVLARLDAAIAKASADTAMADATGDAK